jgi:hypothetical protein
MEMVCFMQGIYIISDICSVWRIKAEVLHEEIFLFLIGYNKRNGGVRVRLISLLKSGDILMF